LCIIWTGQIERILYDDGSFLFEGNLLLSGSTDTKTLYDIGYQLSRSVKGTFNASYLNLGDLSKYSVRKYITKVGDEVFFCAMRRSIQTLLQIGISLLL